MIALRNTCTSMYQDESIPKALLDDLWSAKSGWYPKSTTFESKDLFFLINVSMFIKVTSNFYIYFMWVVAYGY